MQHAHDVGLDHLPPRLSRRAEDGLGAAGETGAVDEHVDRAVRFDRSREEGLDRRLVGDVQRVVERTRRTVRPLALAFYGPVWLLTAWCELRQDFRSFRLDRISDLAVLDERFHPEPGKTLGNMLARDNP